MGCQRGAPEHEFRLRLTIFTGRVLIVEMVVTRDDGTEIETEDPIMPNLRSVRKRKKDLPPQAGHIL